jgi:hypothetical protein
MELAERVVRGRRAISLARQRGVDTTQWERHLNRLLAEAGRGSSQDLVPRMLWEWRRVSIPEWQRILRESIEKEDRQREEYARWMLREILLDPEYWEPEA